MSEPIFLHINGKPAEIVKRCMVEEGKDEVKVVGEALATHGYFREQMWRGATYYVSYDGGSTKFKIIFPNSPPVIPARPGFTTWLGGHPYFPLFAMAMWVPIIAIFSVTWTLTTSAHGVRVTPISFTILMCYVNYVLCAVLFAVIFLVDRREQSKTQKGASDGR